MSWTPYDREKPYNSIMTAIRFLRQRNGKRIVELGTMRMPLNHDIHDTAHECCCDGHSTALWAQSGLLVWSVDISKDACDNAKRAVGNNPKVCILRQDGLEFLRKFPMKIDLLFLDAWDVDLPDTAEKHLEAYRIAKPKLSPRAMILIDDVDVDMVDGKLQPITGIGGKGRLIVPAAQDDGWNLVYYGRQALLARD